MTGNLVMIVNYFSQLRDAFFQITSNFYETIHWKAGIKSVDLINSAAEQGHPVKHMDKFRKVLVQNKKCRFNWNRMLIKDLSFKYENKGSALSHINFNMKPCEKIAVVGSSGSGKSTFLNILAGLYKPDNVQLIINETEFNNLKAIQDMSLFIPQDSEIFENTIGWNINFGFEDDEEKLKSVIKMACLDEVVARFPICSVHRLHLLDMFDKIVVLDKGRIIQEGHFSNLVSKEGHLRTLGKNI